MNYSTVAMLVNKQIRAIVCKYDEVGKGETFKTLDQDLIVGDLVIVESSTRWKKTIVKVTEVDVDVDFDSDKPMLWVCGKFDPSAFDKIKEMEGKAIEMIKAGELRKRREDIRKNTLDAMTAGEIDNLEIARLSAPPVAEPEQTLDAPLGGKIPS